MKNILYFLFIAILAWSCNKEDFNSEACLKLEITELNTEDPNSFKIESNDYLKVPSWTDAAPQVSILRKLIFDVQTPSSENFNIEIWFKKVETEDRLTLSDEVIEIDVRNKIKNWDYKDGKVELSEFYRNDDTYSDLRINQTIPSGVPFHFEVVDAKEIKVDGKLVTWVNLEISGELYGFYTPGTGPGYKVEGTFRGVVE